MMNPLSVLKYTATHLTFKGRVTRSVFWAGFFYLLLLWFVADELLGLVFPTAPTTCGIATATLCTLFMYAITCLSAQRLHDTGNPGRYALVYMLFPVLSWCQVIIGCEGGASERFGYALGYILAIVAKPLSMGNSTVAAMLVFVMGIAYVISFIAVLIFQFKDSGRGLNKYGMSEKYPVQGESGFM